MTKALGYQKEIFNVKEVLEYFRVSNYSKAFTNKIQSIISEF
jgi:hypothetical protein